MSYHLSSGVFEDLRKVSCGSILVDQYTLNEDSE
jgi:hypothetical protein